MKKLFYWLFISFSLFANGQSKGGTATYDLYIVVDEDMLQADKKYGYIQMAIDVSRKLEYKLIFKGSEANFFQIKNNSLDKMAVNMANILADASKKIYQNLNTNTILRELSPNPIIIDEKEFVVKDSISKNWKITNESKLIGEYLCYKATTTKKIVKTDIEVRELITAWFCPALPYAFGPSKYAGLPGLILELKEKNIAFIIKNISLQNIEDVMITIPNARKEITQEEYNKITKERFETLAALSKLNKK